MNFSEYGRVENAVIKLSSECHATDTPRMRRPLQIAYALTLIPNNTCVICRLCHTWFHAHENKQLRMTVCEHSRAKITL